MVNFINLLNILFIYKIFNRIVRNFSRIFLKQSKLTKIAFFFPSFFQVTTMYRDDHENLQLRLSSKSQKNLVFPGSNSAKVNLFLSSNNFISISLFCLKVSTNKKITLMLLVYLKDSIKIEEFIWICRYG